ncbi:MAG: hypothetical protein OXH75_17690 [Acidobacteria bacterium]|nr:hypothetical protein [Acidobacteriota bacterium]
MPPRRRRRRRQQREQVIVDPIPRALDRNQVQEDISYRNPTWSQARVEETVEAVMREERRRLERVGLPVE